MNPKFANGLLLAGAITLGSCAPDETICLTDTDCDQGQVCEIEFCTTRCITDTDCADDESCEPREGAEGSACALVQDEFVEDMSTVRDTWVLLIRSNSTADCESDAPGPDIVGIAIQDANEEDFALGQAIIGDIDTSRDLTTLDGQAWQDECDDAVSLGCDGWVALRLLNFDGLTVGLNDLTSRLGVVEYGESCGERSDELYSIYACDDPNAVANQDDIASCTRLLGEGNGTQIFEL